jgi:hypothetical protein
MVKTEEQFPDLGAALDSKAAKAKKTTSAPATTQPS